MEEQNPTPLAAPQPIESTGRQPLPNQIWSVLVLVAFVLGLGAGYLIWAQPAETRVTAAEQKVAMIEKTVVAGSTAAAESTAGDANQVTIPENVKRYDIPIGGNPIYGDPNAPITIIEFSDYQCPFCQRWHAEVWPQIESKYGDKVRLVYRDFPLESIHPQAIPAAEAADCAGAQNKYWEFNNLLFGGGKELGIETYDAYAQQVGLKMDDFKKCVADRAYQKEVQDDTNYAAELGVRSTPTFFINGLAVVGAQPFSVFDQVISLELAGKIPK